jgi:hypothetical protein
VAALVRRLVSPKSDEGGSQTKTGNPGLIDGILSMNALIIYYFF